MLRPNNIYGLWWTRFTLTAAMALLAVSSADAAVTIKLVAKNAANFFGPDEVSVEPVSDATSFAASAIFYVEVWAQSDSLTGLSSISLDIDYDITQAVGTSSATPPFADGIFHGLTLFTSLTSGSTDNVNGLIDDLSGSYVPSGGCSTTPTGVTPNWSRVALIEMQAVAAGSPTILPILTSNAVFGTTECGTSNLPESSITYIGINEPVPAATITVNLDVDALDALATPTRDVSFVMTECTGNTTDIRTVPVAFASGSATVVLNNIVLSPLPEWISVRTGHTLRRLAPLVFDGSLQAVVNLTIANGSQLISGDWQSATAPQDDIVDATDFSILSSNWNQLVPANSSIGADATGNGVQDTADFTVLQFSFLTFSDGVNGCVGGLSSARADRGVSKDQSYDPAVALATAGEAFVDLELAPQPRTVTRGAMFDISLYAVSNRLDNLSQSMAAMDVILRWDPTLVQLVGLVNNGTYGWLLSEFTNDSGLDGLNNTFDDGNALYTAWSSFGTPALATPDGLLVTTFQFVALQEGDLADVVIEPMMGASSVTRVFGIDAPNQIITGTLRDAGVTVVAPQECQVDGGIDMREFHRLQACYTDLVDTNNDGDPPAYSQKPSACCTSFDYDGDGDVDDMDYTFFLTLTTDPKS